MRGNGSHSWGAVPQHEVVGNPQSKPSPIPVDGDDVWQRLLCSVLLPI